MLLNKKKLSVLLFSLFFASSIFSGSSFNLSISFEKYEKFAQSLGENIILGTVGAMGIIYMFQGMKKFIFGYSNIPINLTQTNSEQKIKVPAFDLREERKKGLRQAFLGATAVGATVLIMAKRNAVSLEIILPQTS